MSINVLIFPSGNAMKFVSIGNVEKFNNSNSDFFLDYKNTLFKDNNRFLNNTSLPFNGYLQLFTIAQIRTQFVLQNTAGSELQGLRIEIYNLEQEVLLDTLYVNDLSVPASVSGVSGALFYSPPDNEGYYDIGISATITDTPFYVNIVAILEGGIEITYQSEPFQIAANIDTLFTFQYRDSEGINEHSKLSFNQNSNYRYVCFDCSFFKELTSNNDNTVFETPLGNKVQLEGLYNNNSILRIFNLPQWQIDKIGTIAVHSEIFIDNRSFVINSVKKSDYVSSNLFNIDLEVQFNAVTGFDDTASNFDTDNLLINDVDKFLINNTAIIQI